MASLNRRDFLQGAAVLTVLSALPRPLVAELISAAAPQSRFGAQATAEEVTEGLDLGGKTYLLTGANSGLGFETLRVLSKRGARVIATARSPAKAETACAAVGGDCLPETLDLAEWDSVVACAERVRALNTPIDGLICNAGIVSIPQRQLVNGIEKHFVVNHLGHFILANQLMDAVLRAEQGRFVWVSSRAQLRAPQQGILLDDPAWDSHEYSPGAAYGHSKLANAMCSRELARRISATTATSNSLHPGVIVTNAIRNMNPLMQWLARNLGQFFTKTVQQGAATQTYLATHPDLAGVRGYYFNDVNPAEGSVHLRDEVQMRQLWQMSEELTRAYLPTPNLAT